MRGPFESRRRHLLPPFSRGCGYMHQRNGRRARDTPCRNCTWHGRYVHNELWVCWSTSSTVSSRRQWRRRIHKTSSFQIAHSVKMPLSHPRKHTDGSLELVSGNRRRVVGGAAGGLLLLGKILIRGGLLLANFTTSTGSAPCGRLDPEELPATSEQ